MKIRYRIEYFLAREIALLARIVPLKFAHFIGDFLGDLFFYVIRVRRKDALENLKYAFGTEKSEKELEKILRNNYRHFGKVIMEFGRMPSLKKKRLLEQIPVHNLEHYQKLFNQKRGMLILSGHLGNWEYAGAFLASISSPFYCIFREQKNILVDKIIKELRISVGLIPLKIKGEAAKGIIKALKEKGGIAILMDQDGGKNGEFINFLGRPASTVKGPALIAIKYKVPVSMIFCVRQEDGSYKVILEKFSEIERFANNEKGVNQFLIEYSKILEKYIRKYPEQWFWLHRRWKTQPLEN